VEKSWSGGGVGEALRSVSSTRVPHLSFTTTDTTQLAAARGKHQPQQAQTLCCTPGAPQVRNDLQLLVAGVPALHTHAPIHHPYGVTTQRTVHGLPLPSWAAAPFP
jgi:hypothetical protein